jgi:hypothetical protein
MTVHEVIHSLEEGKREGFLLKLDLSKAYDQVDWSFLFKVLRVFGFNSRVIKLINQLVTTTSLVVLVNGSPSAFFKPSRGLRQGDLISPILFIILVECLGRMISANRNSSALSGIKPSSGPLVFSHQQFFDDTIVGGKPRLVKPG